MLGASLSSGQALRLLPSVWCWLLLPTSQRPVVAAAGLARNRQFTSSGVISTQTRSEILAMSVFPPTPLRRGTDASLRPLFALISVVSGHSIKATVPFCLSEIAALGICAKAFSAFTTR